MDVITSAVTLKPDADGKIIPGRLGDPPEGYAEWTVETVRRVLDDVCDFLQDATYVAPRRLIWELLEAIGFASMSHGDTLPNAADYPGGILPKPHFHADYSQPEEDMRVLAWIGEGWRDDISMADAILLPLTNFVMTLDENSASVALTTLRAGVAPEGDTLFKLLQLIVAERDRINQLISGSPAAMDTFLEAYNRFVANEDAAAALNSAIAALESDKQDALSGPDDVPGLADALTAKAGLSDVALRSMPEGATSGDNDAAIAARISALTDFSLKPNAYEFSAPIAVNQTNMSLVGPSAIRAAVGDGRMASLTQTAGAAPLFSVTQADFTLEKVHLQHRGADDQSLIVANRSGPSDIDMKLVDVWFDGSTGLAAPNDVIAAPMVALNGRGVEILGGYVTGVLGPLVDVTWTGITELDTDGQGFEKGPSYGMRAYRISGMRGHGTNFTLLRNTGANKAAISGLMVDGNLCDIGGNLFEGALRQGAVSNNLVQWSKETPVKLQGGTQRGLIAELVVSGHEVDVIRRPGEMVNLAAGDYDCLYITGVAGLTRGSVIRIVGDGAGSTTIRRLIVDVAAHEVGTTAGDSYFLHASDCTIDQLDLRGVYGVHANNTAPVALKFDACSVSRLRHGLVLPAGITLVASGDGVSSVLSGDLEVGVSRRADNGLQFNVGSVGRAAISTAGNMGVGTTAPGVRLDVRDTSSLPLRIARESSAGAGFSLASHDSGGTLKTFCAIFNSPSDFTAGSEDGTLTVQTMQAGALQTCLVVDRSVLRPGNDNAAAAGGASFRFSEVFAGNGTVNTSDVNEKTDIQEIPDAVIRAYRRVRFVQYRWRDSVQRKGDAARLHFGAIAQEVQAAFEAEGLDAFTYGLLCKDLLVENYVVTEARRWTEMVEGEDGEPVEVEREAPAEWGERPLIDPETGEQRVRMGLRYDQLFALGCAVQAQLLARVEGPLGPE